MKLRFIVMNTGYVESSSTACLIYQCEFFGHPGYSSYKEAITDLALDLFAKYYDDCLSSYEHRYSKDVKECCRKSLVADKTAKFCSDCGGQISDKEFGSEDFKRYVCELVGSTCDSYGDAEYAAGRTFTWWPWSNDFIGAPKEEVIHITDQAEVVLLAALLEAKPELKDTDDTDFSFCGWDEFKNDKQPTYS